MPIVVPHCYHCDKSIIGEAVECRGCFTLFHTFRASRELYCSNYVCSSIPVCKNCDPKFAKEIPKKKRNFDLLDNTCLDEYGREFTSKRIKWEYGIEESMEFFKDIE